MSIFMCAHVYYLYTGIYRHVCFIHMHIQMYVNTLGTSRHIYKSLECPLEIICEGTQRENLGQIQEYGIYDLGVLDPQLPTPAPGLHLNFCLRSLEQEEAGKVVLKVHGADLRTRQQYAP